MTAVLDASGLVEYLLSTARAPRIRAVVETDPDLHVPALCDVETMSGLRRLVLTRAVTPERAQEALVSFLGLPLQRHQHEALIRPAFELRENFSAYDAVYVVLAEAMGATLVTGDARLARAARELRGVQVVGP